jgi:chitinase
MIRRLRSKFYEAEKQYIITGAPQCIVPDANMGNMIAATKFDIIWVQYYNTPQCSARSWVTANSGYLSTGVEEPSGFSYDTWADFLVGTASADAQLYIGLPGAPSTTDLSTDFYLNPTELTALLQAYYCRKGFGGVMIWEATSAENNVGPNGAYYQTVKDILLGNGGLVNECLPVTTQGATTLSTATINPSATLNTTVSITQAPSSTSSHISSSTTSSAIAVITPSPTQPDVATNCDSFHLVGSGNICVTVAQAAGISLDDLYLWNPTIGGDTCPNLWLGFYVCIGVL